MRIFKGALVFLALAVAGCQAGLDVTRRAPERIALPDGTIVAGAQGWCVDTSSTSADGATAVVVLGSCAAISRNALAPRPDVPGVVTVSVESEAGASPSAEQLESYLLTEQGRAALARDGRAGSVDILETRRQDDLLFLHSKDRSALPGASSDTWRVLFDLDGRFISVSLFGLSDRPIGRREGLATLIAQIAELRAANDA